MKTDKFQMTNIGYVLAMEWLKETKQVHLIEKELSIDGYTIVALANSLYKRQIPKDITMERYRRTGRTTRMIEEAIAYKKLNPEVNVKIYFSNIAHIKCWLQNPLGEQLSELGIDLVVIPKQLELEAYINLDKEELGKTRFIDHDLIESRYRDVLKEYFRFTIQDKSN